MLILRYCLDPNENKQLIKWGQNLFSLKYWDSKSYFYWINKIKHYNNQSVFCFFCTHVLIFVTSRRINPSFTGLSIIETLKINTILVENSTLDLLLSCECEESLEYQRNNSTNKTNYIEWHAKIGSWQKHYRRFTVNTDFSATSKHQ